ncbi:hypothetical protein Tco_1547672 [Tanacetum coccineum]
METCEPADTPTVEKSKLDEEPQGKSVDPTRYRGMINTFMYLTSSRPDLVFVVCMCVRYQAKPTKKHLHTVKQIFRYLRGTTIMGMLYPRRNSCFDLTALCRDLTMRRGHDSPEKVGLDVCTVVKVRDWVSLSLKNKRAPPNPVPKRISLPGSGCCA